MSKVNLILLGPPGGGKGTQAKMLVDKYGIPQISTGDLVRAEIASGSDLGKKVKSFSDSGGLVPDDVIVSILLNRLKDKDCDKGFILDGFPRTVGQAEALGKALEAQNSPLSGVIAVAVPEKDLIERLTGRRICKACSSSFHIKFSAPKKENVCDRCNGELYQRKDDTFEVISNRLKVYNDQTVPVVEYYGRKKNLYQIDGSGKIEMIFKQMCDIIDGLVKH